jgi:hypothetical protein
LVHGFPSMGNESQYQDGLKDYPPLLLLYWVSLMLALLLSLLLLKVFLSCCLFIDLSSYCFTCCWLVFTSLAAPLSLLSLLTCAYPGASLVTTLNFMCVSLIVCSWIVSSVPLSCTLSFALALVISFQMSQVVAADWLADLQADWLHLVNMCRG